MLTGCKPEIYSTKFASPITHTFIGLFSLHHFRSCGFVRKFSHFSFSTTRDTRINTRMSILPCILDIRSIDVDPHAENLHSTKTLSNFDGFRISVRLKFVKNKKIKIARGIILFKVRIFVHRIIHNRYKRRTRCGVAKGVPAWDNTSG